VIFFLDSDTCIFALKGQFPSIKKSLEKRAPDDIKISAIVKAELILGAHKSSRSREILPIVERFLEPFEIVPFDDPCVEYYCKIRFDLEKKGTPIGPNDLLIAATVTAHHGTLVTHNTQEFSRIPHLKLDDWVGLSHL